MKKLFLGVGAILLASTAVPAMARDYYDNGNGYYDNGGYNNGYGYDNGYGYNGYNGYDDRYGYNDCRRQYYNGGQNCNYWNSQYDNRRGYGYRHRHYRSDGLSFGFGF